MLYYEKRQTTKNAKDKRQKETKKENHSDQLRAKLPPHSCPISPVSSCDHNKQHISSLSNSRLISFAMYILGFVWFVLSLVKKYYLRQFSLFAWTHVALLCVVTQSYLIIQNMFEGLIWFIMPIMMVIINDIMAYMFGFTMGRTPLIQLSPKKTWEGFIGGGLATVVMSLGLAHFMCQVRQQSFVESNIFRVTLETIRHEGVSILPRIAIVPLEDKKSIQIW